jgi:hypothetical protein
MTRQTSKAQFTHYKQKYSKRKGSHGPAGDCVSLVTGEVMSANPRERKMFPKPMLIYDAYIQSKAWQQTRQRYLDSGQPIDCRVCGKAWFSGMHFHHMTYERLGDERLSDIVPVCENCHTMIHRLQREFPYLGSFSIVQLAATRIQERKLRNKYTHVRSYQFLQSTS